MQSHFLPLFQIKHINNKSKQGLLKKVNDLINLQATARFVRENLILRKERSKSKFTK